MAQGVLEPRPDWAAASATGWLVALTLGATAWLLRRAAATCAWSPRSRRADAPEVVAATAWLLGALGWWTVTAVVHVVGLAPERTWPAGVLGAAAVSAVLFLLLGRALEWRALRLAALGVLPAAAVVALRDLAVLDSPARGWRPVAWIAVAAAVAWLWVALGRERAVRPGLLVGGGATLTLVLAHAAGQETADATGGSWALAAVGLVLAAALLTSLALPARVARDGAAPVLAGLLAVPVGTWVAVSWISDGAAPPLPRVPLLTPVDVVAVASLAVLGAAWASRRARLVPEVRTPLLAALAALAFGTFTALVLRAVAVVGDVPWTASALLGSSAAQAVLAVAWTLLALVLAVVATRRADRPLWLAGAGLLGLVVAKLFLVDLAQSEALVLVGAFIVVGALVLLIGYVAPLPPAAGDAPASEPDADADAEGPGGPEGEAAIAEKL